MRGTVRVLVLIASSVSLAAATAQRPAPAADDQFLEDLSKRSFMFFWEQPDERTGIVRGRTGAGGGPSSNAASREIGSIASVGFGLTGMCIAAERGWLPKERTLLSAENLRTGRVRSWFMQNPEIPAGLDRVGVRSQFSIPRAIGSKIEL